VTTQYICIHGHFYQPPRENPWLESIETQKSAYPYHDWNERICVECYAPNATSRIMSNNGHIARIVNNYARMSFNFGPTLLWWLREQATEIYSAVIEADAESKRLFDGHGSAMAQAYNHMILPLANSRDRMTQIRWGIRDFEFHFGRKPVGMWLPETAVDIPSLEALAECGITFTVLEPHQAKRVRQIGTDHWESVEAGNIDTRRCYQACLPSGKSINLFFYDGPVSRAIAFDRLLQNGELFATRLKSLLRPDDRTPQLAHVATDGETYGHHHRHGDMALAYALDTIERDPEVQLTNYSQFLANHPPNHEVEIAENSSWSCVHGVERWRSDCGCTTGDHPDWAQAWRAPFRDALDWLRGRLTDAYEKHAQRLFRDPWQARDDFIEVLLDHSPSATTSFLSKHSSNSLSAADEVIALKLLEMQRHAQLMYTSCGWFFDDVSRIEAVQNLRYAARCIQLAQDICDENLEEEFLSYLDQAPSGAAKFATAKDVYLAQVKPTVVNLEKVVAHYAVSDLFENYDEEIEIYGYSIKRLDHLPAKAGRARLSTGRVRVVSSTTRESAELAYGVLHLGDHNLNCGVRQFRGEQQYRSMVDAVHSAFETADVPNVLRLLDEHFEKLRYSLKSLFVDEQIKLLTSVLEWTANSAQSAHQTIYQEHAPLIRFLAGTDVAAPRGLSMAAEVVLNARLRRSLQTDPPDFAEIDTVLEEVRACEVELDTEGLAYVLRQTMENMVWRLEEDPEDIELVEDLTTTALLADRLPFEVELFRVQNIFYRLREKLHTDVQKQAQAGNEDASEWLKNIDTLAKTLHLAPDDAAQG